jgi:hypothetical protein
MNGSASTPSSATMNGTRCAIRPDTKATSRDTRSKLGDDHRALGGSDGGAGHTGEWAGTERKILPLGNLDET